VFKDKKELKTIKINETLRSGVRLLLAVSFLGCYSRGHNFMTTVFYYLFNRILYIGTVPVQVPSAAHTLRDAWPLLPQHVSSKVSSLRMGLILLPCSALLIFFISLLSFNTRC